MPQVPKTPPFSTDINLHKTLLRVVLAPRVVLPVAPLSVPELLPRDGRRPYIYSKHDLKVQRDDILGLMVSLDQVDPALRAEVEQILLRRVRGALQNAVAKGVLRLPPGSGVDRGL